MAKRAHILILALSACLGSWAQARFVPEHTVANVGEIMFQEPKRVTFGFRNEGDKPLTITAVHPSCGCTAVDFPSQPIEAGARGEIVATYDARMLGTFVKELEVLVEGDETPFYLLMQGKVTTNPAVSADDFPIDLDNIRLTTNVIEFDDVNKGDKPVAELRVLNPGRQAYAPQLMHLPPYLKAEYVPQLLAGGRSGRILVTLDSEKLPTMGLNQTSIYLARFSGDKIGAENEITVSAVLLPDFSKVNAAAKVYAPSMSLTADTLRLGPWGKKTKLSGTIELHNTGRTSLQISRLQVFSKALGVSLSKSKIEAGGKAKLKITVDKEYVGRDHNRLRVLLITNDPDRPKQIIEIFVE